MASLNKVFLIGNLTRDPELRSIPSGMQVAEFGLAMNRQYRSQSGEQQEETTFVDIVVWGRQAEVVSQYCSKGKQIHVEGRLQYDSWEGKDGQKRSRLRVVADHVIFLGGRPGEERGGGPPPAQSRRPARSGPASPPPREPAEPAVQERPPDEFNIDEVPF